MSTVAFIRRMLDAGFTHDEALRAAEAFEATASDMLPTRSKGAIRQARYEERQRQKASEIVRTDAPDETLSPSPPPRTPPPRPHTRGDIYTPARGTDFDAFWEAYPAKIGKKAALTAWDKAKDRPDLPAILHAIDRYRLTKPPDRDWCHPSTWLNQGRWDDAEPDPTSRTGNPRHDRPDKLSAKLDNLDRGFRAAERASEFVAANRTF